MKVELKKVVKVSEIPWTRPLTLAHGCYTWTISLLAGTLDKDKLIKVPTMETRQMFENINMISALVKKDTIELILYKRHERGFTRARNDRGLVYLSKK